MDQLPCENTYFMGHWELPEFFPCLPGPVRPGTTRGLALLQLFQRNTEPICTPHREYPSFLIVPGNCVLFISPWDVNFLNFLHIKLVKATPEKIFLPATGVLIDELVNPFQPTRPRAFAWLKRMRLGQPCVPPNLYLFAIAHPPNNTFLEELQPEHDGLPSWGDGCWECRVQKVSIREVLRLQKPGT